MHHFDRRGAAGHRRRRSASHATHSAIFCACFAPHEHVVCFVFAAAKPSDSPSQRSACLLTVSLLPLLLLCLLLLLSPPDFNSVPTVFCFFEKI